MKINQILISLFCINMIISCGKPLAPDTSVIATEEDLGNLLIACLAAEDLEAYVSLWLSESDAKYLVEQDINKTEEQGIPYKHKSHDDFDVARQRAESLGNRVEIYFRQGLNPGFDFDWKNCTLIKVDAERIDREGIKKFRKFKIYLESNGTKYLMHMNGGQFVNGRWKFDGDNGEFKQL